MSDRFITEEMLEEAIVRVFERLGVATKADLANYPTKADLANALANHPTKADLANYPTKADLANALANHPTKADLANYPTKADLANALANHPTKADLANHPTREDAERLANEASRNAANVISENVRRDIAVVDEKYQDGPAAHAALRDEVEAHVADASVHVRPKRPRRRAR